jgi:membrane-associated protease RseP (regulator of RpoE activity)
MRKRAPAVPLDICIPSAVILPEWGTDKKKRAKTAEGMIRRFRPWALTITLVIFLTWGIMSLPDSLFGMLSEADSNKQQQTIKNSSAFWKQTGKDFGMVLLDIQTRQAALSFHVPVTGVYVLSVLQSSLADLSGVQPGDHITGLNGDAINSAEELITMLGKLTDGDTAELTILRGLDQITLNLDMSSIKEQL